MLQQCANLYTLSKFDQSEIDISTTSKEHTLAKCTHKHFQNKNVVEMTGSLNDSHLLIHHHVTIPDEASGLPRCESAICSHVIVSIT